MPSVSGTIRGLDELQAKLETLQKGGAEKVGRIALRRAAEIIREVIREHAPIRVAGPSGTALPIGALAADINIGNVRKDDQGVLQIIVAPGKYTNHVARWVEYGHANVRGGKVFGNTPAHPFIRPSAEAAQPLAVEVLVRTFLQEADKLMAANDAANEAA